MRPKNEIQWCATSIRRGTRVKERTRITVVADEVVLFEPDCMLVKSTDSDGALQGLISTSGYEIGLREERPTLTIDHCAMIV